MKQYRALYHCEFPRSRLIFASRTRQPCQMKKLITAEKIRIEVMLIPIVLVQIWSILIQQLPCNFLARLTEVKRVLGRKKGNPSTHSLPPIVSKFQGNQKGLVLSSPFLIVQMNML